MALTEAEKAELAALESAPSTGLSPEEQAELDALTPKDSYLDKGLRGMDYDRATTGGPLVAKILESITGKDVYKEDEVSKARSFEKDYPSSSELLERAGYAPSNKIANFLLGTGIDMASAPSTWLSGGMTNIGKIKNIVKNYGKAGKVAEVIANPIKETSKALGKSTWKSAFKALDVDALKQGKKVMPSDVLMEGNVWGKSAKSLNRQMGNLADKIFDSREEILKAATDKGGKIDVDKATKYGQELVSKYRALGVDQADEVADALEAELKSFDRLRSSPGTPASSVTRQVPSSLVDQAGNPIMKDITKTIPGTPARPGTSASKASDIKSFYYSGVPSAKWAPYAQTPVGGELKKALGRGLKEATEESVGRALGPKQASELQDLNQNLGALLSTRKKELGEVGKEELKNLFTSTDALALGALGAAEVSPKWWLIKKAADFAKLQGPRSMAGKGMYSLGSSAIAPKAVERSIWSLLDEKDGQ